MPRWRSGQGAAEGFEAAGPDQLGERGFRREHLGRVVGAGVDVQLGGDPGSHEPGGEGDVLVTEHVDGADVDEGRRQAGQVLRAGRSGVLVGLAVAQVPLPGLDVARPVPQADVGDLVTGRGLVPVVDHRVDRHLEADGRAAAVAGEHRHGDGEAAPGAAAVDGETVWVDAEFGGVAGQPYQAGVAVLGRRGIGVLRGQAVLDGDDHRIDMLADRRRDRVLTVDVAEDHAAAVNEVDAGQRAGGVRRPVDPHGDIRRPVGPGNRAVLRGDVGVGRNLQGGQQLRHRGAPLHDVGNGVETAGNRLEQRVQWLTYIRVDEVTTGHEGSSGRWRQNACYGAVRP